MNGIAQIDRQRGQINDAIQMWRMMQEKYPGVNAATYGLADAYMSIKEYDKAVLMYRQIYIADPTDEEAKAKLDEAKEKLNEAAK
jgi:predicted Zn-dependent protease